MQTYMKNKFRSTSKDFQFEVQRSKVLLPNGVDTMTDNIWRPDTGSYLSTVSRGYHLTTHSQVNDIIENVLQVSQISDYSKRICVGTGGNKFMEIISLNDQKFELNTDDDTTDGNGKIDSYVPTLIVGNSYDRTSPVSIQFGAIRSICTNGLFSGRMIQSIRILHNREVDFKQISADLLNSLSKHVHGLSNRLNTLKQIRANNEILEEVKSFPVEFLNKLEKSSDRLSFSRSTEGKILEINQKDIMSQYALLNLITQVATHNVKNDFTSKSLLEKTSKIFAI